jgi:hypothetical protein
MMLKYKASASKILILLAFVLICGFAPANAADNNEDKGIMGLLPGAPAVVKGGAHYTMLTYPSLFRLAWGMGAYRTEDTQAIDSYLKVSECTLYQKFYKNEFKWENIRAATKDYLDQYGKEVPTYYEYVQPLYLGRYDEALQGFPLEEADKYVALKVLQIADYKIGTTPCGEMIIDPLKYPSAAVVNIISPLSLTFIRVKKELAAQYLDWRTDQGLENGDIRTAYIRFRVRLDDYLNIKTMGNLTAYSFSGRLMQIDVYADPELFMPLYNQLF